MKFQPAGSQSGRLSTPAIAGCPLSLRSTSPPQRGVGAVQRRAAAASCSAIRPRAPSLAHTCASKQIAQATALHCRASCYRMIHTICRSRSPGAQPGGAMRRTRPGDSAAGRVRSIMHAASRAHPVGATGPAVTASAVTVHPAPGASRGCPGTGPALGGQPSPAPTGSQQPLGRLQPRPIMAYRYPWHGCSRPHSKRSTAMSTTTGDARPAAAPSPANAHP